MTSHLTMKPSAGNALNTATAAATASSGAAKLPIRPLLVSSGVSSEECCVLCVVCCVLCVVHCAALLCCT